MSRNSVSPFFSNKFQPIFAPASPAHSNQPIPPSVDTDGSTPHDATCTIPPSTDTDGSTSHDATEVPADFCDDDATTAQVSESHSANDSFEASHSTSAPQLHVHVHKQNSGQMTSSPSQPSSLYNDSDNLVEPISSSMSTNNPSQSGVDSSPSSKPFRDHHLSMILEGSYEEKSDSTSNQANAMNSDGDKVGERQVQSERKESVGCESSTKVMSKLEEQRRVLEKQLDDMYPWRQKRRASTGMNFIQPATFNVSASSEKDCIHLDPPISSPQLSIGMRDLEYSMEPRNFSRGPNKPLPSVSPLVVPNEALPGVPPLVVPNEALPGVPPLVVPNKALPRVPPLVGPNEPLPRVPLHLGPNKPLPSVPPLVGPNKPLPSVPPLVGPNEVLPRVPPHLGPNKSPPKVPPHQGPNKPFPTVPPHRGPNKPLPKVPPLVAAPLDSAKNVDVDGPVGTDNASNACSTNDRHTAAPTSATTISEKKLPLSKISEQVSTNRQRSSSEENESFSDQLTPFPKKDQGSPRSGLGTCNPHSSGQASSNSTYYDELLPLSTKYKPPSTAPHLPLSGQNSAQGRHSAALAPLTPPLPVRPTAGRATSKPFTTYSHPDRPKLPVKKQQSSPNPAPVVHVQRREQRYSLAASPSDSQLLKKVDPSPVRRTSQPSKPKLMIPPRPISFAGTQESLGWNFVPGESHDVPYIQPSQKLDKNRWTRRFFGGEKIVHDLFNPRKAHKVKKYLQIPGTDINEANSAGDTPLHYYIKSDRADKLDILFTFLVHCNCKVLQIDKPNGEGKPPLHVAVETNDMWAAKVLITFGADINCPNRFADTPLDLVSSDAFEQGDHSEIHEMLTLLHAVPGGGLSPTTVQSLHPLNQSLNSITNESYDIEESQQLGVYLDEKRHTAFVFKLEELLSKQNLEFSVNTNVSLPPGMIDYHGTFFDAMIARQNQLLRINEWKSTVEFKKGSGSRMLYLDGGGIRGLIEIEVLERIQTLTGRRITELFDWIIGTSTGGILALCLVYLGMTLGELRQLYFRLREEVFIGGMLTASKKSDALENLLQQQFGDKRMSDVEFPKVLITAVSTKTSPPRLNFFNNCFGDEFSTQLVWKVARYTSAAPMYFTECDNYMDGGVLANNPSLAAWTLIQTYHDNHYLPRPKVAMAVSLGTGVYPSQKMGETDILGKGLLNIRGTMKRAQRFIRMISTALVESESVASTFNTTCKALDIKFFRFSPTLPSIIDPDETDVKVLVDMLIHTKQYLSCQDSKRSLDEMVRLFQHISEVSRGLNLDKS